jgi:hypothetical protein
VFLRPEDPAVTAAQCLFALSEFEAETAGENFDRIGILSAAAGTGQMWIVSEGAKSLGCPELAGALSESGVRLLAAKKEDGIAMTKVYTFDELRHREVAHD